jgi:CubicO group peptidase (beta-lactamase class C family)
MKQATIVRAASGALLLAATASSDVQAQVGPLPSSFESHVQESMQRWGLPGVVVVVVKDGEVILTKGYGTRVVGDQRAVDANTLVHVASHSKAVTATAVAMLVAAGKLSWDDPLRKHIPEFAVADSYVTDELTIRDLVSHRGGLPAAAIGGFRNSNVGVDALLEALRTRRPEPFRARQVYSQASIALAGEVVARVSGLPWERFVREEIFAPLGMFDSYTSTPDLLERFGAPAPDKNILIPARKRDGQIHLGEWSEIGTDRLYAPAGGIITTGSDVAKWITFLLQGGEYHGRRLLHEAALAETRVPLIPLDPALGTFTEPVGPLGTGTPGWNAVVHAGRLVFFAPGGWMSSVVAIMPDQQLGVGVFTNAYFSERHAFESLFPVYAIALQAIDLALGITPRDWNGAYQEALARAANSGR